MAKLILLSGPSCVGKGPLVSAVRRFHPDVAEGWKKLVLYNSRAPRPGEAEGADYFFRQRETLDGFRGNSRYLVLDIRGDLQAVDLEQLKDDAQKGTLFFEGNPVIIDAIRKSEFLKRVEVFTVFLSPLSRDEIVYLKAQGQVDLHLTVTDVMRRKLLRRTQKQKTILSLKDLEDIERRAGNALQEMTYACRYDHVIANHDGEDSENWDAFYYPLGDARRTLECFAALLEGRAHPAAETWDSDLLGPYQHGDKD